MYRKQERGKGFRRLLANAAPMKYVLFYESAPDVATKAPLYAAEHTARWHGIRERGELLMIGPFANPAEGAMGIFTTREAAEAFVSGDPFVRNGVVVSWRIAEWMEAIV